MVSVFITTKGWFLVQNDQSVRGETTMEEKQGRNDQEKRLTRNKVRSVFLTWGR